jgi:hypothetical protein
MLSPIIRVLLALKVDGWKRVFIDYKRLVTILVEKYVICKTVLSTANDQKNRMNF